MLVAVSIPIFTSQLEKSRESTDLANLRAAKAEAVTKSLDGTITTTTSFEYDAANGTLVASGGTKIGKGTAATVSGVNYSTDPAYTQFSYDGGDVKDKVIGVTITIPTDGTEPTIAVAFK